MDQHAPTPSKAPDDERKSVSNVRDAKTPKTMPTWEPIIRAVVNTLLIAAIAHLLILPELPYHCRHLCTVPAIPYFYPTSCTSYSARAHLPPPNNGPPPPSANPQPSVQSLQIQLEILFNSTLDEITPYAKSLPETESLLRDIQTALKQTQSGPQHELTLEFDGCRHALTTATRKLDSVQADLLSAVGSLMATGNSQDQNHGKDPSNDLRLKTQVARREKYLDQLAARMRLKTDSLTGDFATVADHLKSLKRIVEREAEARSSRNSGSTGNAGDDSSVVNQLRTFVDSVIPGWRSVR